MSRSIIVIVVAAGLASGCSKKDTNATPGQVGSASATPKAAAKSSAANAVAATQKNLKDACSFVPKEAAARLVPDGKSEGTQFPLQCMVLGKNSGLTITFDTGPSDGLSGESIPGLGFAAYFENLAPNFADAYLTVVLGKDEFGTNHNLHVAVDLHDGKNHKDDAIAVGKDVLAQLAH